MDTKCVSKMSALEIHDPDDDGFDMCDENERNEFMAFIKRYEFMTFVEHECGNYPLLSGQKKHFLCAIKNMDTFMKIDETDCGEWKASQGIAIATKIFWKEWDPIKYTSSVDPVGILTKCIWRIYQNQVHPIIKAKNQKCADEKKKIELQSEQARNDRRHTRRINYLLRQYKLYQNDETLDALMDACLTDEQERAEFYKSKALLTNDNLNHVLSHAALVRSIYKRNFPNETLEPTLLEDIDLCDDAEKDDKGYLVFG